MPAPPPAPDATPDAGDAGDAGDAAQTGEFGEFQPELEGPGEAEFWRRRWRRRRFRRFGRRRFLRWRRRFRPYGFGSQSQSSSDEPDTGDSGDDGDSGDGGEIGLESPEYGETESEFRRPFRFFGRGFRYAPRFGLGYRRGFGWRGRAPFFGRRLGWRAPFGRGYYGRRFYGHRPWLFRRHFGWRGYAPYGSRRWPWLYRRRHWGYRAPFFGPALGLPVPPPGFTAPPPGLPAPPGPPSFEPGGPAPGPDVSAGGSPWILLVQGCLRKLLGPDATPMDGTIGPLTRRALGMFQQQNGLPSTGDLDNATVQALQSACLAPGAGGPPGGGPPPDAAGPPPGGEPPAGAAAAGGPPPDAGGAPAGGAPPDGAAPGGGGAPADGAAQPQGEITLGRHEGESEQEFLVDGAARVQVQRFDPVPLDRDPQFSWAPDAPGLYVIYVGNVPWYVGIAETSIRNRFLQRRKVLHDLQIPTEAAANRSVAVYLLRSSAVPRGSIQRRERDNPRAPFRPVSGRYAILRILEQFYIKRLRNPKGNQMIEAVQFGPQGSLQVIENGVNVGEFPANSRI